MDHKEITRGMIEYLKMNKNENNISKLMDAVKAVLREWGKNLEL